MRNVSFAVSVTRLRTPRIGPARPAMPVSSVTSRSIVWTTDSRGSTYPEGIVHRPFDGPYVLRTTRSSPSRTRNARTDGNRKGRDVQGHGTRQVSKRDGFIPGLVPRHIGGPCNGRSRSPLAAF